MKAMKKIINPGSSADDELLYRTDGSKPTTPKKKTTDPTNGAHQSPYSEPHEKTPVRSMTSSTKRSEASREAKPMNEKAESFTASPAQRQLEEKDVIATESRQENIVAVPISTNEPERKDYASDTAAPTASPPAVAVVETKQQEPQGNKASRIISSSEQSGNQYGYYSEKTVPAATTVKSPEPAPRPSQEQPLNESAAAAAAYLAAVAEEERLDNKDPNQQPTTGKSTGAIASTPQRDNTGLWTDAGTATATAAATREAEERQEKEKETAFRDSKLREELSTEPAALIAASTAKEEQSPSTPGTEEKEIKKKERRRFLGFLSRDKKPKDDQLASPDQDKAISSTTAVKDAPWATEPETPRESKEEGTGATVAAVAAAATATAGAAAAHEPEKSEEKTIEVEKPVESDAAGPIGVAVSEPKEKVRAPSLEPPRTPDNPEAVGVAITTPPGYESSEKKASDPAEPLRAVADELEAKEHREDPGSPIRDLAERPAAVPINISDSESRTSTDNRYPRGPHSTETANRLDPRVPLPTESQEIPGAFPDTDVGEPSSRDSATDLPFVSPTEQKDQNQEHDDDTPAVDLSTMAGGPIVATAVTTTDAVDEAETRAAVEPEPAIATATTTDEKVEGAESKSATMIEPAVANAVAKSNTVDKSNLKTPVVTSPARIVMEKNPYVADAIDPRVDTGARALAAHGGGSMSTRDASLMPSPMKKDEKPTKATEAQAPAVGNSGAVPESRSTEAIDKEDSSTAVGAAAVGGVTEATAVASVSNEEPKPEPSQSATASREASPAVSPGKGKEKEKKEKRRFSSIFRRDKSRKDKDKNKPTEKAEEKASSSKEEATTSPEAKQSEADAVVAGDHDSSASKEVIAAEPTTITTVTAGEDAKNGTEAAEDGTAQNNERHRLHKDPPAEYVEEVVDRVLSQRESSAPAEESKS